MLFGAGCLLTSLVAAGAFYFYSPALVSGAFAILPLVLAFYFQRSPFPRTPAVANLRVEERRPFEEVIEDFRSPSALLFALLLFVQFGNEWSLAGWLPLLLMQGLGVSPGAALMVLAEYWFCLMIGRGVAQALLPRFSHGRLLTFSILAAAVGCLILATTNNLFGATMAVLFTGGGFAMIYPLVAERIGDRFPYYHPGFFNGIFSLAVTGAMLAPAALGYLTEWLGIRAVLAVPFLGTLAVFVILGLIWIESKLNRSR
jgi:fucose permease